MTKKVETKIERRRDGSYILRIYDQEFKAWIERHCSSRAQASAMIADYKSSRKELRQ